MVTLPESSGAGIQTQEVQLQSPFFISVQDQKKRGNCEYDQILHFPQYAMQRNDFMHIRMQVVIKVCKRVK